MGKIAGKVPKLLEKMFDFPYSVRSSTGFFKVHMEQSAKVPKDVYCYHYCFLETKECMHKMKWDLCGNLA